MSDLGKLILDHWKRQVTEKWIEAAVGTCMSIQEVMNFIDIEDEDLIDWVMVDQEIFCCESCSWWCEIGESDEEGDCQDCSTLGEEE